jgi:hypothetical protein
MSVPDFIARFHPAGKLSKSQQNHLNQVAPPSLLESISSLTGIAQPQLRHMTLENWAVSLRSLHDDATQPTFAQYIRGLRVFTWPLDLTSPASVPRIAWQAEHDVTLICPVCHSQDVQADQRLVWASGVLSSCPLHNYETTTQGMPPSTLMGPRPIDSISMTILTMGHAQLPHGGLVHGRLWFRLLRSLVCELEQHPGFLEPFSPADRHLMQIWERCGVAPPRLHFPYDYFEVAGLLRRRDLLSLANIVGSMLWSGELEPPPDSLAHAVFSPKLSQQIH